MSGVSHAKGPNPDGRFQSRWSVGNRVIRRCIWVLAFGLAATLGITVLRTAPTTYYVSTSGNDSNPGTISRPFRTIQRSANVALPGDAVYVRGGTYNERVALTVSGSNGRPITYQKYPGETPVLDGTGIAVPNTAALWDLGSVNYVTIDGFEVRNSSQFLMQTSGHHVTIKNSKIHASCIGCTDDGTEGAHGNGISIGGGSVQHYTSILNNDIYDIYNGGIVMYDALQGYVLVQGNTIHDIHGVGNWDMIECHGTPYVVIKNNVLYNLVLTNEGADYIDCGSVSTDSTHHIVYDNNTVYVGPNGTSTIGYVKIDKYPHQVILRRNTLYGVGFAFYTKPMPETAIYHNTVVNPMNAAVLLWQQNEFTPDWQGITFKNNLFVDSQQYMLQHVPSRIDGSYANIRMGHNVYRFTPAGNRGILWEMLTFDGIYAPERTGAAGQAEFDRWRADTGQEPSGGTRTEETMNALLVNAPNLDFRLVSGSAAIGAGAPLTTTTRAGSGTAVPVVESFYFYNGYGLTGPDQIRVGSRVVNIVKIDEKNHIITVDRSITWNAGDPVSLPWNGSAPDAGAIEFGSSR